MAEKRRGLGRGLGSLIPSQEAGRPSDVFFPPSERSDADSHTEPQETDGEKLPSDPAESMRRAQAGRRTGSAKRAPAKGPAEQSTGGTSAAGRTPAATTKTTTAAATKTAKASSRKPVASSTTGSANRTSARTSAKPATRASQKSKSTTPETTQPRESNKQSNEASIRSADGSVQPTPVVDQDASLAVSPNEFVRPETSVDGVYVSRETVWEQAAAEQTPSATSAADDPGADGLNPADQVKDADQLNDADQVKGVSAAAEAAETNHSVDGATPLPTGMDDADSRVDPSKHAAASVVPRETDGEAGDVPADLIPVPGTTFGEISLDRIRPNPRQPRDVFDEDALEELITSIREIGVLQPVVVRRRSDAPGQYELIMGERRFRASKDAGKTTIPAIVRETSNDDLLRDALLENLHRVDLNPLEEAAAYSQLLEDFNCTQDELSERIGRSRPQISNTIRLLKLPAMVQRRVAAGVLSSGHARALLGLNDGANMEVLAQRVVAEGLSVRATEEAVILLNRGDRSAVSRGTREPDPELAELARSLGDRLDTRVNLVMGKRKGKLSVEFANGEDLSRILFLLGLDGGVVEE